MISRHTASRVFPPILGHGQLRGGRDEPDDSDLPACRYPAESATAQVKRRPRAEPGPRADYAVAMKQIVDQRPAGEEQTDQPESSQAEASQANASQTEAGQADGGQEDVDREDTSPTRAEQEDADQEDNATDPNEVGAGQLDADQANENLEGANETNTDQVEADPEGADPEGAGQDDEDPADADQAAEPSVEGALERFEPSRAGLPEVSFEDAAAYIEEHLADRPWLAVVRTCSRDVQRVFVALDQGHGHAHIRHDSWVTEEMNERRIRKLEDPAQLDPEKREARVDAFKVGNEPHGCGSIATRITNPEIFAETFTPRRRASRRPGRPGIERFDSAWSGRRADIGLAWPGRPQILPRFATGTGRREHEEG